MSKFKELYESTKLSLTEAGPTEFEIFVSGTGSSDKTQALYNELEGKFDGFDGSQWSFATLTNSIKFTADNITQADVDAIIESDPMYFTRKGYLEH